MQSKITTTAIAGIEKVRVPVANLAIGMFVTELDRPWIETPFLVQGFTLRNEKDIATIRQYCKFVYVDITRGLPQTNNSGAKPKPEDRVEYKQTASFSEALETATPLYAQAKNAVSDMFNSLRTGSPFNTEKLKPVVEDCVGNIVSNPAAMLWMTMIKNKDEYTSEHSLNVAILSIALGRREGLSPIELENLGFCAMLHDIGKVKIPENILNKEGSLDDTEFDIMKMHTVHGKKLLMSQADIPPAAVDIALSHHERLDGKGYPRGLAGEKIPYYVRIVAIADAYDAMTSGRIYSEALPPAQALKRLLEVKGKHHDEELLAQFIDCIGIYPVGSIAELTSGEIGIVLPATGDNALQPRVLVVLDAERQGCEPQLLDLSRRIKSPNGKTLFIRALHADGSYGVSIHDYPHPELQP